MGNLWSTTKEPPPPMVLVPPLFDFPPLAARTRMLESSYNVLFGKLALRCLFEDYFEEARHFSTRIMLKPIDDPHVDLIATVAGPLDHKPEEKIVGNAQFRWQSDVDDPHTFVDLFVSNTEPILLMRSCAYYQRFGFGAFGIFPVLLKQRVSSKDYGIMGLRYGSSNLSVGATVIPFFVGDEIPKSAWLVSKMGRLTAGVQYEPTFGSKDGAKYKNLANWSCAIGYGLGSGSPLSPSFNFGLELAKNSQFIASFYQHVVVQRRVKNPLEENDIVGITNYIDFGFELQTRIDDDKSSNNLQDSTFQVATSWQANKNFLLKGKVGPLSSSIALAFKSWWKPSFTFSMSAVKDRIKRETAFGFSVRVDNIREASYQRADPNFVMLTPNKEHLAEGIHWKIGKRPVLQSDVNSGNFDGVAALHFFLSSANIQNRCSCKFFNFFPETTRFSDKMESSKNGRESNEEISEKDENILSLLDSVDTYLTLVDSLSSTLRQGWLELASARHSMGASRINSTLFDLKFHRASTTLQVNEQSAGPDRELPHLSLCKWASSNNPEKNFEEAKFGEDELLKIKSNSLRRRDTSQSSEIQARSLESVVTPVSVDDLAQRERSKLLSMFGTLVSPKLRASQVSFETALEMLVEISNMRASLLSAYDQVKKNMETATK